MTGAMAEETSKDPPPGVTVRGLMRRAGQASLATTVAARGEEQRPSGGPPGWPYASLVLVTLDHDASPLMLLSDLSDHVRNIKADPRVALLFDGTAGYEDPLAGPRASVLGTVEVSDGEERLLARVLARHPGAELYAGFKDFHLYRVRVECAHLVAGFGRIHWIEAGEVLFDAAGAAPLAAAEPDIVAHMNEDHADAVALIARQLLGLEGEDWRMTGVDPEGADLRRGKRLARFDFTRPVSDPESCRAALVAATKKARERAASAGPSDG